MSTSAADRRFRVIGPGRAGGAMAHVLTTSGWTLTGMLGRNDDLTQAAGDVELLVIAVPDAVIAPVAAAVVPGDATVIHLSGSRPLADLEPHEHVGSLHPLVSLPDPERGAALLMAGATFAIDGDPVTEAIVAELGGRTVRITDDQRSLYHATASIAANHLVALTAQVERLARLIDVPVDAYWDLMTGALDNVKQRGSRAALTGPAARGDWGTIAAHLEALPASEVALYEILGRESARLAGHTWMDEPACDPRAVAEKGS